MPLVNIVLALILIPFVVGALLFCLRHDLLRKLLVFGSVITVFGLCLTLAALPLPENLREFPINVPATNIAILAGEIAMSLFILYISVRAKHALIALLTLAQTGLMVWFEFGPGAHHEVLQNLFVDKFTVIMALINGIIGGGICVYALGYMKEYHETAHRDVKDRRPFFFGLLFVFMSAMFGLLFSNNLIWLFFFWEVTTLCSFLLIGYTRTEEAKRNAARALFMNLVGGVAFALAIVILFQKTGSVELQVLIDRVTHARIDRSLVLLPAALLCLAGMTKSAQLPFSSWLLGAMVAPTPVSALLHSSTMVKAGVYLILRMAPIVIGTKVGMIVALIGGATFVISALAAITVSDAKRVLAWSTIGNLGLIVLCGGIGTYEAVWAGVLLIIFHAIAKCLLFLCVGVVEHKLHSRNIEDMAGLIVSMPRVSVTMQFGMAGMFLAPFGMLISKWAVLKAVVDANPVLCGFIVYGSAATLFFWVKWMGKLLEVVNPHPRIEKETDTSEAIVLYGLSAATALACLLFPLISRGYIEPYVLGVFGKTASLDEGNVVIMVIMMVLILLFPITFFNYGRGVRVTDAYLGGVNEHGSTSFRGSANAVQNVSIGNYYLLNIFDETALSNWGAGYGAVMLAIMFLFV
jgi:ech hydrogenase subunit A